MCLWLADWILGVVRVRNGDWLGYWGREQNEGQWSKHGGKNKNMSMQHLVILWGCWLPQGTVGSETTGLYRRGQTEQIILSGLQVECSWCCLTQKVSKWTREGKRMICQVNFNSACGWWLMCPSKGNWSPLAGQGGLWVTVVFPWNRAIGALWLDVQTAHRNSLKLTTVSEPHACATASFPPYHGVQHRIGNVLKRHRHSKVKPDVRACRDCLLLICKSLLSFRKRDCLTTVLHYFVWSLNES